MAIAFSAEGQVIPEIVNGLVKVSWDGHPSPFDDPAVVGAIARGSMPAALATRLQRFEHNERISRVPGQSEFTVGPEHGFSRTYVWGPDLFEVWMDPADWQLLQGNQWDRWMFRDVYAQPARRPLGRDGWRALLAAFDAKPGKRR
jgi:hypothetical protein